MSVRCLLFVVVTATPIFVVVLPRTMTTATNKRGDVEIRRKRGHDVGLETGPAVSLLVAHVQHTTLVRSYVHTDTAEARRQETQVY